MHCLLCHEKIPRLRAWTGKSEFCCDEHAELYKKQTMDRLLVDDAQSKSPAPALPISDGSASAIEHILRNGKSALTSVNDGKKPAEVGEPSNRSDSAGRRKKKGQASILLPGISTEKPVNAQDQSADEALAALQALAAEVERSSSAGGDLLDEFSDVESSLERLEQLESLPVDLAVDMDHDDVAEAPELELDTLEFPEAEVEAPCAPELVVAEADSPEPFDAPDLQLDALAEAQQKDQEETLEPPELVVAEAGSPEPFDAPDLQLDALAEADQEDQEESLEPPELVVAEADSPESFDAPDLQLDALAEAEQEDSLTPPDADLEQLLADQDATAEQNAELSDPPEPADFEVADAEQGEAAKPLAVSAPRRAPKATPKLRPSTELQEMSPSPNLPEGGYALKPWTDALAVAGPDRASLLSPVKFLELRKSSLNGTASAKFDPALYRASERVAAVTVPISEPKSANEPYSSKNHIEALMPCSDLAWPAPLHKALIAAEMSLGGKSRDISVEELSISVKQPSLSAEFLSTVALKSHVLEPRRSTILSPQERDVFASAAADEEESGSKSASAAGRSDSEETDGGERAHVADLF